MLRSLWLVELFAHSLPQDQTSECAVLHYETIALACDILGQGFGTARLKGKEFVWAHVRLGSKADICAAKRHVRFTPESGHVQRTRPCLLLGQ
jgi:hypothetical protein